MVEPPQFHKLVWNQIPHRSLELPSGNDSHSYGTSPFLMGKLCEITRGYVCQVGQPGGRVQVETPLIPLILRAAAWHVTELARCRWLRCFSHLKWEEMGFVEKLLADL